MKKSLTIAQIACEALEQVRGLESLCCTYFGRVNLHLSRQMSATLRTLLVGSSGQRGLILDCLSTPELFPLRCPLPADLQPGFTHVPGCILSRFTRHHRETEPSWCGPQIRAKCDDFRHIQHTLGFNQRATPVHLENWLEQPFLRPNRTIRSFIKLMANKAGGSLRPDDRDGSPRRAWPYP